MPPTEKSRSTASHPKNSNGLLGRNPNRVQALEAGPTEGTAAIARPNRSTQRLETATGEGVAWARAAASLMTGGARALWIPVMAALWQSTTTLVGLVSRYGACPSLGQRADECSEARKV
jgi:hypothetical protein